MPISATQFPRVSDEDGEMNKAEIAVVRSINGDLVSVNLAELGRSEGGLLHYERYTRGKEGSSFFEHFYFTPDGVWVNPCTLQPISRR